MKSGYGYGYNMTKDFFKTILSSEVVETIIYTIYIIYIYYIYSIYYCIIFFFQSAKRSIFDLSVIVTVTVTDIVTVTVTDIVTARQQKA